MALYYAGIQCAVREVDLKHKPQALLDISAKATVPVLHLPDGRVIDESLDIMRWALAENDPEQWAKPACGVMGDMLALISLNDSTFKYHLDRYKYPQRFDLCDGQEHFRLACEYLAGLEQRLAQSAFLFGDTASLADAAVFPFVRQFAAVDTQAFESLGFVHVQQWLSDRVCDKRFLSIMGKRPVWQAGNALSLLLP